MKDNVKAVVVAAAVVVVLILYLEAIVRKGAKGPKVRPMSCPEARDFFWFFWSLLNTLGLQVMPYPHTPPSVVCCTSYVQYKNST